MALYKRVFWPDTHTPWHDKKAVWLALDIVKDFKPDELVVMGDFFDCYSVSRYDQDPQRSFQQLEDELEDGRKLLGQISKISKAKSLVFLEGNHEARIGKYIKVYAQKLASSLSTEKVLQLPEEWKFIPYGPTNKHYMGSLVATHGSYHNQHVAAKMVNKYRTSVIFAHTHRVQMFCQKDVHGNESCGYNIGWLGSEKYADYLQDVSDWSLAFAVGWFTKTSHFIDIIRINKTKSGKYSAIFQGKYYEK
jgi:hypothetical protein